MNRSAFGASARHRLSRAMTALAANTAPLAIDSATPPTAGHCFDDKVDDNPVTSINNIGNGALMDTCGVGSDASAPAMITKMAKSSGAWSAMNEKNTLAGSRYTRVQVGQIDASKQIGLSAGALH